MQTGRRWKRKRELQSKQAESEREKECYRVNRQRVEERESCRVNRQKMKGRELQNKQADCGRGRVTK